MNIGRVLMVLCTVVVACSAIKTLVMLVDRAIFVAYSEGKTLQFYVDDTGANKRLVPLVRIVEMAGHTG